MLSFDVPSERDLVCESSVASLAGVQPSVLVSDSDMRLEGVLLGVALPAALLGTLEDLATLERSVVQWLVVRQLLPRLKDSAARRADRSVIDAIVSKEISMSLKDASAPVVVADEALGLGRVHAGDVLLPT